MRPCPEFYGNDARRTPAAAPQLLTRLCRPLVDPTASTGPREPDEASASECPRERRQPQARFSFARRASVAARVPETPARDQERQYISPSGALARQTAGRSENESDPCARVVPLWYPTHRLIRLDRSRMWSIGTQGTLRDASTPTACRLGAERSRVQISPPRLRRRVPGVPRVPDAHLCFSSGAEVRGCATSASAFTRRESGAGHVCRPSGPRPGPRRGLSTS